MGEEYFVETEKMKLQEKDELSQIHFVLVHGISGGGWCWYKIKSLMEISCYKVTCLDLKGAGIHPADPTTVLSFDDYNEPLIEFLSSLPENEQVILVGHSAGGLSVTDATHKFPKKVRLAVYVAATMLRTGFVTEQDVKDGIPDLSEFGEPIDVYDMGFGLGPEQPPSSAVIKRSLQRKIIYQMSPLEDSTLAAMLLRPGPIQALKSAQFKEGEDVEKVPRIYIRTAYDRVVKPEQQDAMIKKWPPQNVYTLESDHSPFFSAPFLLFGLIIKAASSFGCSD
ncbi:methylesterase 17 [Nicotiana sylvestris]|uniref:Methylesterase 17-like n=1 Tax=Nicotiana sylvestris TaxID=4096 RepID=A0A1U7WJW7_NICSY|nr:PREDICTED: methylesterase 17-like [Nicotiana sylvestris]